MHYRLERRTAVIDFVNKQIRIGNKFVGEGCPTFIIAEMSGNHLMSYDRAVKIIEAAHMAGADAIKLQTYTADTITIDCDKEYFQIKQGTIWDGTTFYSLYKEAFTPWEWQPKLIEEAAKRGMLCFSSPFDFSAVDFMQSLNMPAYKIASFEINDIPLIRKAAETGKPIIISTGIAYEEDIALALEACHKAGNDKIILLKCTTSYPAAYEDMNLRVIPDMIKQFGKITGLSDHSAGSTAPITAVALGAKVIEKHLTLSRTDGGPDAAFSMEPEEFRRMVCDIRNTEKALGTASYELSEKQLNSRKHSRSLFITNDIKKGETFTKENLRSIRPGYGLHTRFYDSIIGSKAAVDIERGEPLNWDMIAECERVKAAAVKNDTAVVLGSGTEAVFAIREAKKAGMNVIALDGDKDAQGLKYADISYVTDIMKPENIYPILDTYNVSAVLPVPVGRALLSSAAAAEHCSVKGVSRQAADYCTDKYKFHRLLSDNGLRNIECLLIKTGEKRHKAPNSFPVIVKPRFGSGSRLVYDFKDEGELAEGFDKAAPYNEDFIIETAVGGQEYGIDAAIADGRLYTVLLRKKLLTPPPARQCIGYTAVDNAELLLRVNTVMKKAVNIMGLDNCILHSDIIVTDKDIFIIEISARPSGHYLHNIFTPLASGVNLIKEYINFSLNKPYSFETKRVRKLMIRYFDFENCHICLCPNKYELMQRCSLIDYRCNIKAGEYMHSVKDGHSIMSRGYFIVEGCNEYEMIETADSILAEFKITEGELRE